MKIEFNKVEVVLKDDVMVFTTLFDGDNKNLEVGCSLMDVNSEDKLQSLLVSTLQELGMDLETGVISDVELVSTQGLFEFDNGMELLVDLDDTLKVGETYPLVFQDGKLKVLDFDVSFDLFQTEIDLGVSIPTSTITHEIVKKVHSKIVFPIETIRNVVDEGVKFFDEDEFDDPMYEQFKWVVQETCERIDGSGDVVKEIFDSNTSHEILVILEDGTMEPYNLWKHHS